MIIAKQIEIRDNIKKYFDLAFDGDTIIVPRKESKNVVIISENEYNRLTQIQKVSAYANAITSKDTSNITRKKSDIKSFNLSKLQTISELKENWNGNGAPAFSPALIEKTKNILSGLTIQPEIFPTALSTIQIEYDNSRRDHMEIEISETDATEIFIVTFDGHEELKTIPSTIDAINETVGDFYG